MKHLAKPLFLTLFLLLGNAFPALANNINLITPYWGTAQNTYEAEQYGLKLEDSQEMQGIYLQSINPEQYQWNLFVHQVKQINYADLTGLNFTYDHYFGTFPTGKNVLGFGVNFMRLDLDGAQIPTTRGTLDGFSLVLDTASLYMRYGIYLKGSKAHLNWSVMPWLGGQADHSEGDGLVNPPGPGTFSFKVNDDQYSWITGLNLKADYLHFLQAEAKHTITFNHDDCFHKNTVMLNLFLNRNWGLSYRFSDQETASGNDKYHIWGIIAAF